MKRLILMQGCSGSGKSTFANLIKEGYLSQGATVEIHSTDNYFMKDGTYNWNRNDLNANHKKNFEAAVVSISNGVDIVIIDNTNTKKEHVKPYIDAAQEHGYTIQVLSVSAPLSVIEQQNNSRTKDRRIPENTIVDQLFGMEKLV